MDSQSPFYLQAVLIEHDQLALSELSAVVLSGGRKGDNLIKDYDQVYTSPLISITCKRQGSEDRASTVS